MENNKKKKIWKRVLYVLLAVFIIGGGAGVYAYQKLQPKSHFKDVTIATGPETAKANDVEPKSGVFNVLLMGTDQRKIDPTEGMTEEQKAKLTDADKEKIIEKIKSKMTDDERGTLVAGHSDSMIIVHVDLDKKQYDAISIPRDTRVYLKGYGYTKLTSVQYIIQSKTNSADEGVRAAMQAVSNLTGVTINYYAETTYWGVRNFVDSIGGIDINVPFDITLKGSWIPQNHGKVIKAGPQTLDGTMAVEISRERKSVPDGEFSRQKMQEIVLMGVAKSVLKPQNIVKLPKLIKSVPELLTATNMTQTDMLSLGLALKDFKPEQLKYRQLPGKYQEHTYDDALKNTNDQYIVDQDEVKKLVAQHFSNN